MTANEAKRAFFSGARVDLKCYHGTFLNREIVALKYQKDKKGKYYATVDLTSENDKNGVITAGVERCELAEEREASKHAETD